MANAYIQEVDALENQFGGVWKMVLPATHFIGQNFEADPLSAWLLIFSFPIYEFMRKHGSFYSHLQYLYQQWA